MTHSAEERERLIASYATGYADIFAALEGITEEEMEAREGPGEWCPREIIHHLGDSELDGAFRIRTIVAEEKPVIIGWHQNRWIDVLYSKERPIEPSLAAFKAAREATVPLLRLMTDAQWLCAASHSMFGTMSADDWLAFYGLHAQDHAAQIRRARETLRS